MRLHSRTLQDLDSDLSKILDAECWKWRRDWSSALRWNLGRCSPSSVGQSSGSIGIFLRSASYPTCVLSTLFGPLPNTCLIISLTLTHSSGLLSASIKYNRDSYRSVAATQDLGRGPVKHVLKCVMVCIRPLFCGLCRCPVDRNNFLLLTRFWQIHQLKIDLCFVSTKQQPPYFLSSAQYRRQDK